MLAEAAYNNDLAEMQRILSQAESVPFSLLQQAMQFACRNGHIQALELLLQHGADLNLESVGTDYAGHTPLTKAANFGQVEVVRFLIKRGADVNYAPAGTGNTPLTVAIDYEADSASQIEEIPHMAASALLFEAGADPNKCNLQGKSAMSLAKQYHYQEALCRFKVTVNLSDTV